MTEASTAVLLERSWLLTMQALALRHGGLLLHGCSFAQDDHATVVIGPSGAGKTTLARRVGAMALHDDLCVVARTASGWRVWAQTVYRPFGRQLSGAFALRRLLWLCPQRDVTRCARMGLGEASMALLAQTYDAAGAAEARLADAVAALLCDCGLWSLEHCLADDGQALDNALWGHT